MAKTRDRQIELLETIIKGIKDQMEADIALLE